MKKSLIRWEAYLFLSGLTVVAAIVADVRHDLLRGAVLGVAAGVFAIAAEIAHWKARP